MTTPAASIQVNVDVTNPGQFFACCGLLELADRLWPGAEGWFDDEVFSVACNGATRELLTRLLDAPLSSTLTDEELKRLGTLLSAEKGRLTDADRQEKESLRNRWKNERLFLAGPFGLWLDWWRDEQGERTDLKTWAAKQFVLEILRPLLCALRSIVTHEPFEGILQRTANVKGLPFYFDSEAYSQNTPRDIGFGLYTLREVIGTRETTRPALEVFAFLGMQRFRPEALAPEGIFRFNVWSVPLPCNIAAAAACRRLSFPKDRVYQFRLLDRTKYMKAFLPATPWQGE